MGGFDLHFDPPAEGVSRSELRRLMFGALGVMVAARVHVSGDPSGR